MTLRCIGAVGKLFLIATTICLAASDDAKAQNPALRSGNTVHYEVTDATERISMVASTSRVLTMEYDVPFVVVGNQQILKANPVSPNQILITAIKPGVTALSMTDPDNNPHTIEVLVTGDARELQHTLETHYPNADLKATAIKSSVLLSGHVEKMDDIPTIVQISKAFFPEVINELSVGGSQKIMLKVKVVEVSRTKLRKLGIDWSVLTSDFNLISGINGLISPDGLSGTGTIRTSASSGTSNFNMIVDTLEQNNLAKVLAEPTLVTMSGRPAGFLNGGEVPVPVNSGLGTTSVEFQPFGTQLDFVPIVLGNGRLRLEVRPEVRDLAGDLRDPVTGAPGFRTRRVDTGVEMQVGHTLALAGLMQNRVDTVERGVPVLKDMPWIGAAFRRKEETFNEVELVVLVTPYFVNEVDGNILPAGPGRSTVSPTNKGFYWNGYEEVPRCGSPYELGPKNGNFNSQSHSQNIQYQQQQQPAMPAVGNRQQHVAPQVAPENSQAQQLRRQPYGYDEQSAQPVSTPTQRPSDYSAPQRNLYPEADTAPAVQTAPQSLPQTAPAEPQTSDRYFPRPSLFGIGE